MRLLRQIHAHLLTRFLPISSLSFALSKIVAFCALSTIGDVAYACRVFSQIPRPSIFCWNVMIRACSKVENPSRESIFLFKKLIEKGYPGPNTFTLAFVLKACSVISASEEGRQVHSRVLRSGFGASPFVQTALLNMYAKCEEVRYAQLVFEEIPDRNLVAWSAMIGAYARVGLVDETFGLFREMQIAGVAPDQITLVSVICACVSAGSLDIGRWVHAYVEKKMIKIDLELGTALINMYAKCGCIEKAKTIFGKLPVKDTKAWTAMISGLAIHGLSEEALNAFSMMEEAKVKPDHVTFRGILSACGESSLVSEGQRFWSRMLESGIEPSIEQCSCMVDLLCRAGSVEEAHTLVQSMAISPNPIIWRTLLVGCRKNRMLERGELIAKQLLELEPLNAENYVLLSSLYASVSQWEKMRLVRVKMKEKRIRPVPACSSVEVDGVVHDFTVGDLSHPEAKELREVLKEISYRTRKVGYYPSITDILHKVINEEKEDYLGEHSERLAIAYGLWKTKAPTVIRVVKNIRICGDCHEVTKIISKIYQREIIVRDRFRLHKFVDGSCTCKDYW